ncbi:MAG: VWA domain-containing protein [Armatimonadetes bacterium]|nr:VWA domain-containing protein [Armatimonadota bacterium]
MHLIHPWGLAWLGLAVPIILLYLLRLKRREMTVSSVLFWEHAVEDLHANAPFQRLRRNLLLLLQLLILACCAVAAARPYFHTTALGGGTVIAILDGSASMKAPLGNASRFGRAREQVEKLIAGLERGDELMLLLATDRAEVLAPLTSDKRSLAKALSAARPSSSPTDLRDALFLAASAARGRPDARIFVFSDGATPPVTGLNVELAGAEMAQMVTLGEPVDNVAVTALDSRREFGAGARRQVLLTLAATGPGTTPRTVEVQLRADGRLFDVRSYTVTPGRPKGVILDDLPPNAGLLEVRKLGADALPDDDRAYVSLGSPRRTEVWLVGKGNLFLEKALEIDSSLKLVKTSAAAVEQQARAGGIPAQTVVVFCGDAPAGEVDVPSLYLDCAGAGAPVRLTGKAEALTFADWSRTHPVTRDVDFGEVAVRAARTCRAAEWGSVVAEAAKTPLVVAGERKGVRRVYVGFDLLDSDFPLRAGFPIFISNALSWLAPSGGEGPTPTARCGEPLAIPAEGAGANVAVTAPDGTRFEAPVSEGKAWIGDTRQVGLYQVQIGATRRTFACSLLSPEESDLTPRSELKVGRATIKAPTERSQRNHELWRWLVALALVGLMGEWWLFHRRG